MYHIVVVVFTFDCSFADPDKVTEDEKDSAEQAFVKISEAYAVLSDEEKRKIYDKYGKNGLDAHEKGQDPRASGFGGSFGGGGGGGQQFHFNHGGSGGFDPFTMFEQFFAHEGGSAGGFGGGGFPGGGFPGGGFPGGGGRRQVEELYPKSSPIAKLGRRKFPDKSAKNIWFITFYDNNNQSCIETQPTMLKLAEKLAGIVKIGAINCEKEPDFCEENGVSPRRLPAFASIVDGNINMYEQGKSATAKAMHEFIKENMPFSLVQQVNRVDHVKERLMTSTSTRRHKGSILLLTDKYETSSLYASLAYTYRDKISFGETRAKNLALAKEFGVKKYPMLVALIPSNDAKGYDVLKYEGDMKADPISSWIDRIFDAANSNSSQKRRRRS